MRTLNDAQTRKTNLLTEWQELQDWNNYHIAHNEWPEALVEQATTANMRPVNFLNQRLAETAMEVYEAEREIEMLQELRRLGVRLP